MDDYAIKAIAPTDWHAVGELFRTSFSDADNAEEGALIGTLAEALMAINNHQLCHGWMTSYQQRPIAAILFSRVSSDSGSNGWLLSPVAVATEYQQRGLGQQLIRHGIEQLVEQDADWLVTYGDPNFYSKVGFEPISTEQIAPPFPLSMPHGWIAQSLNQQPLPVLRKTECVAPFADPALW